MELVLDRFVSNAVSTLGRLKIDGKMECYVCEDAFHPVKIQGQTRIPAGKYEIKMKPLGSSRFDASYSKKFTFHKGMLELQRVPNYAGILIHIGNKHEDTEGCLLVGKSVIIPSDKKVGLQVVGSRDAYVVLYPKIVEALTKGKVFITILDNDRKKDTMV